MLGRGLDRQRCLHDVPPSPRLTDSPGRAGPARLSAASPSSSSPSSSSRPHATVSYTQTPSSSSQLPTASKLLMSAPSCPPTSSHYRPLYFSLYCTPTLASLLLFSLVMRSCFLADLGFFFLFTVLVLYFEFPRHCLLFSNWVKSK